VPLTDQDRAPWLANIKEWIDHHLFHGSSGIVTCSALKKTYRIKIIAGRLNIKLLYIKGCKSLVSQRILGREGHFMPPNLLASQFADLEEPDIDEEPMILSAKGTVCDQADQVIRALALVDPVRQNP
jgi:carbohydrate kinase (thermoresistant glucokinase family)